MTAPGLLSLLYRSGALRTLDHAFARTLQRLDPDTPDAVLAAAALASLAVGNGHAGLSLHDPRGLLDADPGVTWPQADGWQTMLVGSPWVDAPADPLQPSSSSAPLVLEHGLLYLRRYREYERRLALGLQRIGTHPAMHGSGDDSALSPLFAQLFPDARSGDDRQAHAAALALHHHLLLVTGGPGTGKTTTITRMLVLLVAHALHAGRTAPRIALAAPTGRAAERMAESVRTAARVLADAGIDPTLLQALPGAGTTLHRLLGSIPDSPQFRHHAGNRLLHDIVVVDEASMIDLPLMAKLVEAVAEGARLVLLGDPDQLPSVEAGDVLAGILAAAGAGAPTAADDAHLHALATATPATVEGGMASTTSRGFSGRRIQLLRGWRQSAALQLAPLAEAVRSGDGETALQLLRSNQLDNVFFHAGLSDPLHAGGEALLSHWSALAALQDPAQALRDASRLRLLTAVRDGPQGARTLNTRIEAALVESGGRSPTPSSRQRAARARHFHGQLLQVTENSYRHRLFNGDIGICLRDNQGVLVAWFPGDSGDQPRGFHPATLPAHESAFAMTVHKAQGSEFDSVWLLLPERDNRVLSRELVYTGITRARQSLHVAASPDILRTALSRHVSRTSALGWRLAALSPPAATAEPLASAMDPAGAGAVQGQLF